MMRFVFTVLLSTCVAASAAAQHKSREEKVREDKERVTSDGFWIYNDMPRAFEEARRSGKPILVGLRCIPCEECVKLDDHLVDTDPVIRPLLEQFVCVRVVATNGLDLNLFQYDTDQSFAMFMLNADRTIYGRFGTRSHRTEWYGDVSLKGLAEALRGGLELHKGYPGNKVTLAGKTGAPLEFASPELYPALKDRFTASLNYQGEVAKSCIHCHQIGDARRDFYRAQRKPVPPKLLHPFPHPKSIGLILDPDTRSTVKSVVEGSLAADAGLKPADQISTLDGQPILSIADVQWVLNETDAEGAVIQLGIKRGGKQQMLSLKLPSGWREADDIAWRVSSWGLRRMVTGGLKLEALSPEEQKQLNIAANKMALRVTHVGQYGPHAAAKKAGFQKGDILTSYDGQTNLVTPGQLLAYGAAKTVPGQRIKVSLLRGTEQLDLQLPMQD